MPSLFSGMDPYLEKSARWSNVHGRLIAEIANTLSPLLLPKYQPIIEESVYRTSVSVNEFSDNGGSNVMVGVPDVAIQKNNQKETDSVQKEVAESSVALATPQTSPIVVEVPVPTTFRQRFIEIRNTDSQEVVTVIEVLSPVNKRGDGHLRYLQKRNRILESQANLIEIDLLHKGKTMPMTGPNDSLQLQSHYRILVSPVSLRPQALLYPFSLFQTLPSVEIPLKEHDQKPTLNFQALLDRVYDLSGYAFSIDYSQPPKPSWEETELAWIASAIAEKQ